MDVTDDESIQAGVRQIIASTGRIDVLVNNAGYGSYGAVEDVSPDEVRCQAEVNVFGAMRLTQLVLPHMRRQRGGTTVNVTSMGGRFHSPLGGWHHASKYAIEERRTPGASPRHPSSLKRSPRPSPPVGPGPATPPVSEPAHSSPSEGSSRTARSTP